MLRVYHAPHSRSVRILWLLEELGVPYELETLEFKQEVLKSSEYLAVHPLGKVPALSDDGVTMFESGAIVEYVLERYGQGRLAPEPGAADRAPFLQWLHFAEATALPPLYDLAQHTVFKPKAERIPAVAEEARARAALVLGVLEDALRGKRHLLGDEFSAADIMTGYSLWLMQMFGLVTEAHTNLRAYLDRLAERPAFRRAFS